MMIEKMFRVGIAGLLICASLVLMTGCDLNGNDDIQPSPVSYVSLYNASPDGPDLDIVVDNRQINTYPFEYSDNTGYLRFYTGNRNLKFGPYGANNIVIDTTLTFENEKAYSIFVVDDFDQASVVVLNDNAEKPGAGKARVRFVNLSPDGAPFQLKVKDETTALIEEQSFKEASDFIEVDAKRYDFDIAQTGDSVAKLQLPDITLQEGWFYTILIRGYATPPTGNTNVLSAEVIVN